MVVFEKPQGFCQRGFCRVRSIDVARNWSWGVCLQRGPWPSPGRNHIFRHEKAVRMRAVGINYVSFTAQTCTHMQQLKLGGGRRYRPSSCLRYWGVSHGGVFFRTPIQDVRNVYVRASVKQTLFISNRR